MATKYTLTTAFTAITETSGTIQNVGNESVELASSTNAVAGEGIVLNPGEKRSFKGALSARSLGDAGAEVNVVDFTEAGEGGEEYILPIASDTTLGGVKISNSFTVASDGTLSIKKSGKTILGAVKSSDDEGKVTVNNDGTMTYNPLGYRQPSTAYAVGNMKYHSALPTGWYLECTTAGTSSNSDLTISSPTVGGTVTDGTVVWTIRQCASTNNLTSFTSGILTTNSTGISRTSNNSQANLYGGTPGSSGRLKLVGGEDLNLPGGFSLTANDGTESYSLEGRKNGDLSWDNNDLAGSAIVAKSLTSNGYIKYASGLIMQWGRIDRTEGTSIYIPYPISFSQVPYTVGTRSGANLSAMEFTIDLANSKTGFTFYYSATPNAGHFYGTWLAIGY